MLRALKLSTVAVVCLSLLLSSASMVADVTGGTPPGTAASTTGQAPATPPLQGANATAPQGQDANPRALGGMDMDINIYKESLKALTILFVVAVLLESAFAVIFNWRVFLAYFSRSGVKTIVMIVVSLVVVYGFKLDVVSSLLAAYQSTAPNSGLLSKFITALVLAGGSAGVFNIMRALGYRSERPESEVSPKPPANKAWVAFRVTRMNVVGDVRVTVRETADDPADAKAPAAIAGTIAFRRQSLGDLLIRRKDRFPQNGGYILTPNRVYEIAVEGRDAGGNPLQAALGGEKGDKGDKFVFAPGAIVDFNVTL